MFQGIQTSDGKHQGLYQIEQTGVNTAAIINAAREYLSLLSTPELIRTQYAVDDPEWRRWFNVDNGIYVRQGLSLREMTKDQRERLMRLASLFINNMNEGHAKIRMDEVRRHLSDTWFAWVGETQDDSVFYYRIHSPVILIEFDHQFPVGSTSLHDPGKPTRDHIHVVIRTPNGNDYGKDLLGQHLANHRH